MMRQFVLAIAFLSSVSFTAYADTQVVDKAESGQAVLFIGNSFSFYNNGVHNHLGNLLRVGGQWEPGKSRVKLKAISGGYLSQHLKGLPELLHKNQKPWHKVLLQGHSTEALGEKKVAFGQAIQETMAIVEAQEGQAFLVETWTYKEDHEMEKKLTNSYAELARKYGLKLIPVGTAFAVSAREYPEIDLYLPDIQGFADGKVLYQHDIKHPSLAGTYLYAATVYCTLFRQTLDGNAYNPGIPPEQLKILQSIASRVAGLS